MKVKSESEVAQSYPTLSDPMDCSLPGSSIHGIFQARVLEWGAIAFSSKGPRIPKTILEKIKKTWDLNYLISKIEYKATVIKITSFSIRITIQINDIK